MRISDFKSYKKFVEARFCQMPSKGRGQYRKLAEHLNVHSSLISQIFRGAKHLTPEQACLTAHFIGLTETEAEYFVLLVQRERAGNAALRRLIDHQLERVREAIMRIGYRLPRARELNEQDKAVFYSQWHYSAVRMLTSLPGPHSVASIAEKLDLPAAIVSRVLKFLLGVGLVNDGKEGYRLGPSRTHLPPNSPLAARHHTNWRLKALERLEILTPEEIAFTAVASIGEDDRSNIHEETERYIEAISRVIESGGAERLYCLNVDWFRIS